MQPIQDLPRCPCCGDQTLTARGDFEICGVCRWQDDGQGDHDADQVRGGPNGDRSLTQARALYRLSGSSRDADRAGERSTRPDEMAADASPSPPGDRS